MYLIKYFFRQCYLFLRHPKLWAKEVHLHPRVKIIGDVSIGERTNINGPAFISGGTSKCIIKKYCAIGHNLRIRTDNHNLNYVNLQASSQAKFGFKYFHQSKGPIEIGNAVWIGDNVIILPGVIIADGAVVGAGSVVTKNVKPYSIVAGTPAKEIKKRFSEDVIDFLMEIQWWNWSDERIKLNKRFFESDLKKLRLVDIKELVI